MCCMLKENDVQYHGSAETGNLQAPIAARLNLLTPANLLARLSWHIFFGLLKFALRCPQHHVADLTGKPQ